MKKYFRLATLALLLTCASSPLQAQLLFNGGFETGESHPFDPPTVLGAWSGDDAVYTPTTLGITPYEGSKMLQFLWAAASGGSPGGAPTVLMDSQYYQSVDLSAYAANIALGRVVLSGSAMFNRIPGDAQTDTEFAIRMKARSGTPTSFTDLGEVLNTFLSDGNVATWQQLTTSNFVLPAGTSFVQFELYARENIFNDTFGTEFDGHFADAAVMNLTIVPEPGSLLLLTVAAGYLGHGRFRRRRAV